MVQQASHLEFYTVDMADEELPYEHQLEEIAVQVNWYRDDNIQPESSLSPTFRKYFPIAMELGVLADVKWNDISGLFVQSPVLPMTYVDNEPLLATSHQRIWEAESLDPFHPQHCLAVVKLFPAAPVYAMATVYVPAIQERLCFLTRLVGLHQLQMEVAALVYMPKNCTYMPKPSSGDHYMLLPLTVDKNITIGTLSSFTAAKLTVVSKHSGSNMGVHLKLPPNFSLQLDGDDLINKSALSCGPLWKNQELVIGGKDRQLLLVNGKTVVMEAPIKVVPVDQFMPLQCAALTNVGYEPKFVNDAFTFKETVAQMRQCLHKAKTEVKKKE